MRFTEEEIKNGYLRTHSTNDWPIERKIVDTASDKIKLACTQLNETEYQKKKIVNYWCEFLKDNPTNYKKIHMVTRMNQQLFNAICHQKELDYLFIKWLVADSIEQIQELRKLQFLYLDIPPKITCLNDLAKLKKLRSLYLINSSSVKTFSFLGEMRGLEELVIASRVYAGAKPSQKQDLSFLKNLSELKVLSLFDLRLETFSLDVFEHCVSIENIQIRNLRYKENGKWKTFLRKDMELLLERLPNVRYHNLDRF
ncbi:hypothetical protein HB951_01255 [Listeria welshimeri]|nr:hypothetical protein [Listeria welshimeri]MBC1670354.1 hypothetical protein [Listeria welshimeri]